MYFKKNIYEVKSNDGFFYIGLGLKVTDWTNIFYKHAIFSEKDLELLEKYIDRSHRLFISKENEDEVLEFLNKLAIKMMNYFSEISIQSEIETPIKKEIFAFISARRKYKDLQYNFRSAMVKGFLDKPNIKNYKIKNDDLTIKKEKTKSKDYDANPNIDLKTINITPEVEDFLKNENNQIKSTREELVKKADVVENLLSKIKKNNKKIDEIQNEISKLNIELLKATNSEKKGIYSRHSVLTKQMNILLEENENIELQNNNEKSNHDTTSLTAISEDFKYKIKSMDEEMNLSTSKLDLIKSSGSRIVDSIQPKIKFTSGFVETNDHFEITNIIKKNSMSQYKSFYAVIFNLLNKGTVIKPSYLLEGQSTNELKIIYEYEMVILSLLRYGYLNDKKWIINIDKNYENLFIKAYDEIIHWTKKLCSLVGISYQKPKLILNSNEGYDIVHKNYDFSTKMFSINSIKKQKKLTDLWISDSINYRINTKLDNHKDILLEFLNWIFGFSSFREGQLKIIQNFLNGNNTLGILPTGGGKSLTYYFGVLFQPRTSLVIAPINSLIIDQIDKLTNLFGIDRYANLTSSNKNMREDLKRFLNGDIMFSFASPERAQNHEFRNILIKLNFNKTIGSVILDEVHCLSEWGHDFRVPYLMLSETLNTYCKGIRYLGLTATASINVVRDLLIELTINEKDVITSDHMRRENLSFEINSYKDVEDAQFDLIANIDKDYNTGKGLDISRSNKEKNSVIIFSQVKRKLDTSVETLFSKIKGTLSRSYGQSYHDEIAMYTGDLKDSQEAFMKDEKTLLIATKAFGMGIDKPNIRMTVHFGMPSSREAFYQEAGRAGRDGKDAKCKLYAINPKDFDIDRNVKNFLNPNTTLYEMKNILRFLTRKKVDIATAFYFFLDSYEKPEIERDKSLELFEKLKKHQYFNIVLNNEEKKNTEKYLYILFKLGIVKNWTIRYLSSNMNTFKYVDFEVELNHKMNDMNHIKKQALKYIKAYQSEEKNNLTENEQYFNRKIEAIKENELGVLILIMRQWYHNLFITTRREQIANMYQLIKDFANKGPTIEIQNVIDRFFNIKDSIGKTTEGYDLVTFEGASLKQIIDYAFVAKGDGLIQRKYEMEVVMQSNVNAKNSLYTSIIHLRLDEFEDSHNGDQRFDFAMSLLTDKEKNEVIESLVQNYLKLSEHQKVIITDKLNTHDNLYIHKLYELYENDNIVNEYVLSYIESKFDESWL